MWMATVWRSNALMYVAVPYDKGLYFLTSQSEVDFGNAFGYVCLNTCFFTIYLQQAPLNPVILHACRKPYVIYIQ